MKHIITISRYLLAVVFIFSGFVKGVDPLGSAYKFHDYFMAFHLNFLDPLTLTFSFVLCAAELAIGLLLLFGVQLRIAAWGAFIFMLVFTPLTLVLAIFNPVSDCGCFGDAIHLSNWQTFFKNILFFAAALLLFLKRKTLSMMYPKWKEYTLFAALIVLSFLPSIDGYLNLPMYDFRPYKIGVNISNDMKTPDGSPADEYSTILYYQKDGVVKEFDESNYPWDDSTWTFVDAKSTLVKKGYTPPISNFSLHTVEGEDITERFINSPGYSFFVVAPRLEKANPESFKKLTEIYYKANTLGHNFICATSTPSDQIADFKLINAIPFPIVTADEVTLKTIVRANPGLLILYNGTIIGKWHWRNFPEANFVDENMLSKQLHNIKQVSNNRLSITLVTLLLLIFVIFVKYIRK